MPRGAKLADYRKEESKSLTIAVPKTQYAILIQFAEATNRTVNDATTEIFLKHTVAKIIRLLSIEATAGEIPNSTKKANTSAKLAAPQPSSAISAAAPQSTVRPNSMSPHQPASPLNPSSAPRPEQPPQQPSPLPPSKPAMPASSNPTLKPTDPK